VRQRACYTLLIGQGIIILTAWISCKTRCLLQQRRCILRPIATTLLLRHYSAWSLLKPEQRSTGLALVALFIVVLLLSLVYSLFGLSLVFLQSSMFSQLSVVYRRLSCDLTVYYKIFYNLTPWPPSEYFNVSMLPYSLHSVYHDFNIRKPMCRTNRACKRKWEYFIRSSFHYT